MKKIILLFISFFCLLNIAYAKGVELVSFEPVGEVSNKIEIIDDNNNNFNINFLDSNQEIKYKAIFKNTETEEIKITSINFNQSRYNFLNYNYEGIMVGELIKPEETKEVIITIKTNNEDKQTIEENFNLTFNYEIHKIEDIPIIDDNASKNIIDIITNPETLSKGILAFVILLGISGTVMLVLKKKKIAKYNLILIIALSITSINILNVKAEETLNFSIKGIVKYTNVYKVTIDPNLGTYNNSTNIVELDVRDGESIHIETPTRDTYTFVKWEVNGGELDQDNNLVITKNTSLKALWNEIYYTLTIDTDGGTYNGISGSITNSYRPNIPINLLTPQKEGHTFSYWTLEDNTRYDSNSISLTKNTTLKAHYTINNYTITINPNGGKYNNNTSIYTDNVPYGTEIDLTNISRTDYELVNWTKNNNSIITDTSIIVKDNTTLVANWRSTIFFNVNINPNGGLYNDSSEIETHSIRNGETFTLTNNYRRNGYNFLKWEDQDGNEITAGTPITITKETTIKAIWEEIICSIGNTTYGSIAKAHEAAEDGDTILLLKSTTEEVTTSKKVTIDLNENTLTGSITNTDTGDLILLNGTLDNPNGTAITNNGILTIGKNDLKEDGTSNIEDNIAIMGTDVGIKQNNVLNIYDGYVEGNIALDGGYDDSPYYRNTFDGEVVHYYPFINHNNIKNCQTVNLEASDRAVSKTKDHGEIYYYNLQDNINTSIRTGYTIYAVRDFDASYALNIPENEEIIIDTSGFNIKFGENINNNGKLRIENSNETKSELSLSGIITNKDELIIKNTNITKTTNTDIINNEGKVDIHNSTLKSLNGYTIYLNNNTMLFIDENTILQGNSYTIYNPVNNSLVINKGTVGGVNNYGDFELSGSGKIISNGGYINNQNGNIKIDNGNIDIRNASYLIYSNGGKVTINDGNLYTIGNNSAIYLKNATYEMNGGVLEHKINSYWKGSTISGSGEIVINNGEIKMSGTSKYDTLNVISDNVKTTINNGTIRSEIGVPISIGAQPLTINGGEIISDNYEAITISGTGLVTINNGHIKGNNGIKITRSTMNIKGGKIEGTIYGINATGGTINIGTNDEEIDIEKPEIIGDSYGLYISSSTINYYDGILKGKTTGYNGNISSIPQATEITREIEEEYEKCYLKEAENFLRIGDNEYNSFESAYNEIGDEETTIELIKTTTSNTSIPSIETEKEIVFDLKGNQLLITQTINNAGKLTIKDSSDEKNGMLTFNSTSKEFISNTGELRIISGNIVSTTSYINNNNGTIIVDNGNIDIRNASYLIYSNGGKVTINDGNLYTIGNNSAIYLKNATYEMNGGVLEHKINSYWKGSTISGSGEIVINNGEIKMSGTSKYDTLNVISDNVKTTINNGTIRSEIGVPISIGAQPLTINGGEIISDNYEAITISGTGLVTINNGHIKGNNGIKITRSTMNIKGGKIEGTIYGINATGGTINIGTNDEEIDIEKPEIIGDSYGLYISSSTINYYDGVLKGKTAGYNGNISSIPQATEITREIEEEYEKCYLKEAENFLRIGDNEYNSFESAYNEIGDEETTIELIKTTTSNTPIPSIETEKEIVFDLKGNQLLITQTINNDGKLIIKDSSDEKTGMLTFNSTSKEFISNTGELRIISGNIVSTTSYINNNNGTIIVDNGNIDIRNASYLIYSNGGKVTINDGNLYTIGNSSAIYLKNATYEMNGGVLEHKINSYWKGSTISGSGEIIINNGEIKMSGTSKYDTLNVISDNVKTTINNGTIRSEIGVPISIGAQPLTINGGEIISDNYEAITISGTGLVTINNGHIKGNNGIKITRSTMNIKGGKIEGTIYGINATGGTINIGTNDEEIDIEKPEIIGDSYGLYISSSTINYYDGILKGKTAGYNGTFNQIDNSSIIIYTNEIIDGEEYLVNYLGPKIDTFDINGETFTNIHSAINNSQNGDTIYLIEDAQEYNDIIIEEGKNITVDLNGHDISINNSIINNGNLSLINTSQEPATIKSEMSDYIINNNGILNMSNILLVSNNILKNNSNAEYNGSNVSMTATNIDINNAGIINVNNGTCIANKYSLYSDNGNVTVNGTTFEITNMDNNTIYFSSNNIATIQNATINGKINIGNNSDIAFINSIINTKLINNTGRLELNNSSITGNNSPLTLIDNKGELSLDNNQITNTITSASTYYAIKNTGQITSKNNSTIRITNNASSSIYSILNIYGIYNDTNTNLNIENLDISIVDNKYDSYSNAYGIYNNAGNINIYSGNMEIQGFETGYGIYMKKGVLEIGIPEEVGSINYGKAEADVSTTNPLISSITNIDGGAIYIEEGRYNFYDGKLISNKSLYNIIPSQVEYLYEPKSYIDEETGYEYVILKWMREQNNG